MPARLTLASSGDGYASLLVAERASPERIADAERALEAIRTGEVDGVVIGGEEVVLLGNAHHSYRAMIDRMQQGALTVSAGGEILYVNDRFARMLGGDHAILGHSVETWFSPAHRDRMRDLLRHAQSGSAQAELELNAQIGPVPVLVNGEPAGANGAVTLVITDLSEQRRHLEIEQAGRRKDEFLAVLAHELRNPLAPIRNAVQVLQWMPELSQRAQDAVNVISRQSATLTRLVDDLLDINRVNQGKITLKTVPVDVRSIVANALEAAQPLLDARHHALTTDLPPTQVVVNGDPVRLCQVIVNLLSNAAKYTPPRGHVRVALERHTNNDGSPRALVRVRDSGVGIAPTALRHIFEPYMQVSGAGGELASGLGLGLTLARRLVELHGGTIEARSAGPGQGSEFIIDLPASDEVAGTLMHNLAQARVSGSPISGMRILVADDNPDSVQSLAMLLTLAGHETRTAFDGQEALRAADEFRPDVAFLDIGMPNLDGYATARELRRRPWAHDLALFALTGWGQPEDKQRARDAGFDAHVVKPLDFDHVAELIASAARRRERPAAL